jgi:23S rRNA (uridine2552-2'-O)-methyltransferase
VVDLGCWPGGWLQVAAAAVGPAGRVVGVDLAPLDPPLDLVNVFAFSGDFSEAPVLEAILEQLGGPAQVLLSDAAPKLTGVRATDRAREEALLEAIERALPRLLAPGGALLVKLLDCPESAGFVKRLRAGFDSARELRPEASRKGSSERYLVAKGYRAGAS